MSLPFPSLYPLRLASPKDVPRIAVVATSGFRDLQRFDWERPYHEKYPKDTLLSFRQMYAFAIKSPKYIVVVAVDKYDPEEGKKSMSVISPDNGAKIPAAGDEVVVGLACWRLEPGSKRKDQFQNEKGPYPELPSNLDRDKNQAHCILFAKCAEALEKKYFGGYGQLGGLAVHPAYKTRGHGTNLVKWGMELARMDRLNYGLIADTIGQDFFAKLGWKILDENYIEGDEISPEGVSLVVMEYNPTTM